MHPISKKTKIVIRLEMGRGASRGSVWLT